MTTKLIEVLSRARTEHLNSLLGDATVALVGRVVPGAGNPKGLAELVVSQYSPAGSLRTPAVRTVALGTLLIEEAEELCVLLGLPTGDPSNTLHAVGFDRDEAAAATLRAWFLIDYDDSRIAVPAEPSRRIEPRFKMRDHQTRGFSELRRRIADPSASVLVNMPAGAGKLRLVATALADLFRSEPEGQLIVWLALGERLCEDAYDELVDRWREIGTRDLTAYRLYGDTPVPDLANLHNGIVVADIGKLASKDIGASNELQALGRRARVVVLNDATHVVETTHGAVVARMREGGRFSLVGLCAASDDFLEAIGIAGEMRRAYLAPYVAIDDPDPAEVLRRNGDIVTIEGETCAFPSAAEKATLATRDELLVRRIVAATVTGQKVVFFAESAEQARMFVGILALKAALASAVTGSMSSEQRSQEIARFNGRDDAKVLCVHDVLVSGSDVPRATATLVASRELPAAVHLLTIGRLASGRGKNAKPLAVMALEDDVAALEGLMSCLKEWKNLENGT